MDTALHGHCTGPALRWHWVWGVVRLVVYWEGLSETLGAALAQHWWAPHCTGTALALRGSVCVWQGTGGLLEGVQCSTGHCSGMAVGGALHCADTALRGHCAGTASHWRRAVWAACGRGLVVCRKGFSVALGTALTRGIAWH